MLKVILLDDEYIVVEGMKKLVNWEKYGIEIVATADNGLDGLDIILHHQPDIVFIDIRMPGLDGLAVIEKVSVLQPNICFVILSGFRDFEYAKKAIALGVIDYIEKPVTINDIESVLRRASYKLDERKLITARLNDPRPLATTIDLLEQTDGFRLSEMAQDSAYTLCIGQLAEWGTEQQSRVLRFQDILRLVMQNGGKQYHVDFEHSRFVLIFFGREEELAKLISACYAMAKDEQIVFCAGISAHRTGKNFIRESIEEAKEALRSCIFADQSYLMTYQSMQRLESMPSVHLDMQNELLDYLRRDEGDKIESLIHEFFAQQEAQSYREEEYRHMALEIVNVLLREASETRQKYTKADGTPFLPHVEMEGCKSLAQLKQWVLATKTDIMQWMMVANAHAYHKSIAVAKDYIDQHYDSDITLFSLSELAKLNPAYFSTLFKEEVGTTYVKYITKKRLEKAKELLNQGFKIKAVSEKVGYPNYRYFIEIFKKYTGVTPNEFKKG